MTQPKTLSLALCKTKKMTPGSLARKTPQLVRSTGMKFLQMIYQVGLLILKVQEKEMVKPMVLEVTKEIGKSGKNGLNKSGPMTMMRAQRKAICMTGGLING